MKKLLILCIAVFLCVGSELQAKKSTTFTVATYNIRQLNTSDSANGDGWNVRCPYVANLIRFHGFDIFGTEEGFYSQLEDLKAKLPGYEYIGVGRDDGQKAGEHSAIFYNTTRFQLLDHGDFWLTDKDETKPSLGWDAACIRICTWGKFKEKSTGFTFVYYNLHMDHIGVTARAESAKMILRKIKEMPRSTPVILSGDFNVDQHSPSYLLIENSGILGDAHNRAAIVYQNNGTFNSYSTNSWSDSRIDHIFLTPEFKVLKYGVLTDTYRSPIDDKNIKTEAAPTEIDLKNYRARVPSDHFPVMVVVDVVK